MADNKYFYGLGRRKESTAQARLYSGTGKVTVNEKPLEEYFSGNKNLIAGVTDPIALVSKQDAFDVVIKVSGGGLSGQVDAIKLAIAKALVAQFPDLRTVLKHADYLKRDSREKERKKYGLRGARKKEQFSKR